MKSIDNQSWLFIHDYVLEGWKHIPILLTLERVMEIGNPNHLTKLIWGNLINYGGLTKMKLQGDQFV